MTRKPYGFVPEPTHQIDDYFTHSEQKALLDKLKQIYADEGQLMADAKRDPIACVRRPNETAREFTHRCHAVPEHLNRQAWQWSRHQEHRREIKNAIANIRAGSLPTLHRHAYPDAA